MSCGEAPNGCPNASLMLCAGSVLMSSTDRRVRPSCSASDALTVVFPTPPFPPTKIHRSDGWSTTLRRLRSISSSIAFYFFIIIYGYLSGMEKGRGGKGGGKGGGGG